MEEAESNWVTIPIVEEEEDAWIGLAIIEDVDDSDNKKLGLSSRLKANFGVHKDGKVDCFVKRVDGILELIVGNEVQEMKPIKENRKSFAFDEEDGVGVAIKVRIWWWVLFECCNL